MSRGHFSISAISQLLLARFWSNFKQRVLGTYTTDYNCHHDICPCNIFPGDICLYQQYLSFPSWTLSTSVLLSQKTKFQAKGKNFLLQEEISCHRIKFSAKGKHFLLSSTDWLIKPIFCVYDSLSVLPYVWVSKAPTSNINFHTS